MSNINLIPWRKELRKRRQSLHIMLAALILLVIATLLFIGQAHGKKQLEILLNNNKNLEQKSKDLERQYIKLQQLKLAQQKLLEKIQKINALKIEQLYIPQTLACLSEIMPDNVYLIDLKTEGRNIKMQGISLQTIDISNLFTHIGKSKYLQNPSLITIKKDNMGLDNFALTCEYKQYRYDQ